MSKQYQLTRKIYRNLQKVCEKYDEIEWMLKIENEFFYFEKFKKGGNSSFFVDYYLSKNSCAVCFPAIQEKQIRQILVHLQEVLGENPEYQFIELADENKKYKFIKSQAEALCQKWLDGLTPLFDTDPISVLTELNEILQSLLK
jgi:hypothetical protein